MTFVKYHVSFSPKHVAGKNAYGLTLSYLF